MIVINKKGVHTIKLDMLLRVFGVVAILFFCYGKYIFLFLERKRQIKIEPQDAVMLKNIPFKYSIQRQ